MYFEKLDMCVVVNSDDRPFAIPRSLIGVVGLNAALILNEIYTALTMGDSEIIEQDDRSWIRGSVAHWQRVYFPFWSVRTVERELAFLADGGFLMRREFAADFPGDRSFWYSVEPSEVAAASVRLAETLALMEGSNGW